MPQIVTNTTTEGLKATTFTVPTTGSYNLIVKMTTPTTQSPAVSQGPGGGAGTGVGGAPNIPSQIVLTVTQTGQGTILTTSPGSRGFQLPAINATAGDVITITPSSALASDQQSNAVRVTSALSGPN